MKKGEEHTTNYFNTFVETAEDCSKVGEVPIKKGDQQTIAQMQFDILSANPYRYTSDDVLFEVFAQRNNIPQKDIPQSRKEFFSKGQPCFRASPLTKSFGWGVHSNRDGQIALVSKHSKEYDRFVKDESVTKVKAMRSKRK